jgi:two-component system sensor histidine kinase TctE
MRTARTSLRARLLAWVLLPILAVWTADAVLTYDGVKRSINVGYDRMLSASALAISEHVTLGAGEPIVDLPPIALEMLDTGDQERVFYRVSYRVGAGPDTFVTGYEDLPLAPAPARSGPSFFESSYRGEPIRGAALQVDLPGEPPTTVRVEVAETLLARSTLTRRLLARSLGLEGALIALTAALVWLGVARGLRPLLALSGEVSRRSPAELTPIGADVPREVQPLVAATNDLMQRVRDAIAAQRRFIADASHQLRTPLAVLRAEADSALRLRDAAALRGAVERLAEHSKATSHLATQLLALARAERGPHGAGALEPLDLAAVARDTCAALVPGALARAVDLGFEGEPPVPIRGDAVLVRELVANLVDNAVRHGRPGGRVTVSVARGGDGAALLAVEDDGPGIPAGERERVLERFYRMPGAAGEGCGLGLAIVSDIARGHGAALRLLDGGGGRGLRVEVDFGGAGRRAAGPAVERGGGRGVR